MDSRGIIDWTPENWPVFAHDPNTKWDYVINWRGQIGNDTVDPASDVIVPPDITDEGQVYQGTLHAAFLSGGQVGNDYTVEFKLVTAPTGRTDTRRIVLRCKEL